MTQPVGIDRTGIDQVKTIAPTGLTKQLDQLNAYLDDIIEDVAELNQSMAVTGKALIGLGEDIKLLSQTTARLCVKIFPLFT